MNYFSFRSGKTLLCMHLRGDKCTKYLEAFRNKPSSVTVSAGTQGSGLSSPGAISQRDTPTSLLPFLLTAPCQGKDSGVRIETALLFELWLVKLLAHKY